MPDSANKGRLFLPSFSVLQVNSGKSVLQKKHRYGKIKYKVFIGGFLPLPYKETR